MSATTLSPDPWARVSWALEVIDQRIAGSPAWRGGTLPTEDVIGKIESFETSISAEENDKVMIPDHPWHSPSGELLREVKLHRARGGCLGARSR